MIETCLHSLLAQLLAPWQSLWRMAAGPGIPSYTSCTLQADHATTSDLCHDFGPEGPNNASKLYIAGNAAHERNITCRRQTKSWSRCSITRQKLVSDLQCQLWSCHIPPVQVWVQDHTLILPHLFSQKIQDPTQVRLPKWTTWPSICIGQFDSPLCSLLFSLSIYLSIYLSLSLSGALSLSLFLSLPLSLTIYIPPSPRFLRSLCLRTLCHDVCVFHLILLSPSFLCSFLPFPCLSPSLQAHLWF